MATQEESCDRVGDVELHPLTALSEERESEERESGNGLCGEENETVSFRKKRFILLVVISSLMFFALLVFSIVEKCESVNYYEAFMANVPTWEKEAEWSDPRVEGSGNLMFNTTGGVPVRINGKKTALVIVDAWANNNGTSGRVADGRFADQLALMMVKLKKYGVRIILQASGVTGNYDHERYVIMGVQEAEVPDYLQRVGYVNKRLVHLVRQNAKRHNPFKSYMRRSFTADEQAIVDTLKAKIPAYVPLKNGFLCRGRKNISAQHYPTCYSLPQCACNSKINRDNQKMNGDVRAYDESGRCWCDLNQDWFRSSPIVDAALDPERDLISSKQSEIFWYLEKHNIEHVIIVGGDATECVIHRAGGILGLHKKMKYMYVINEGIHTSYGETREFDLGVYSGLGLKTLAMNWDL